MVSNGNSILPVALRTREQSFVKCCTTCISSPTQISATFSCKLYSNCISSKPKVEQIESTKVVINSIYIVQQYMVSYNRHDTASAQCYINRSLLFLTLFMFLHTCLQNCLYISYMYQHRRCGIDVCSGFASKARFCKETYNT